jgi:predicted metal-dependent hydrolase
MKIGLEGIIIIVISLIFFYFIYITYINNKLEKIVSKIDDREYLVQDKIDSQEAADLIAKIRQKIQILKEHLNKSYPDDERIKLLNENLDLNNLKEGIDDPNYTSYSINKGEQIVLCLRNEDKLMDINTMMFVILHELGHVITIDIGHTPNFWENFRWLLEESINIGIYSKQDFDEKPVEYCGMNITSSPLD